MVQEEKLGHRYRVQREVSNAPASGPVSGPTVSIIMPAHNADGVLERAVASVLAQTFQSWELLIVDDASRDDTAKIAAALAANDARIRLLSQPERAGAAQARNRAIRTSKGRFIAFLDADDEWLCEKLSRQLAFMQETGAALSYSGFYRLRAGANVPGHQVKVPKTVSHKALLNGNVIGCLTAIYDSKIFGRAEMPDLWRRQDYALWLKLLRRIEHAHGLQEPLAIYHSQKSSLSSSRIRGLIATWQLYRGVENLSRTAATIHLAKNIKQRLLRG